LTMWIKTLFLSFIPQKFFTLMATCWTAHPMQKLTDPKNVEKPILSSHCENIAMVLANTAAKASNGT
jgi:hypothetical protein